MSQAHWLTSDEKSCKVCNPVARNTQNIKQVGTEDCISTSEDAAEII